MNQAKKNSICVFIIPNKKFEGAQNFFRRLHEQIKVEEKILFIEEGRGMLNNFFKLYSIKHKTDFLNILTTVNSNKLGLIFKIFFPSSNLIMRLGNTISLEIKSNSFKYLIHKFFYLIAIRKCSKFIFQSQVMMDDFINFFGFKNSEKFLVIHNGISDPIIVNPQNHNFEDKNIHFLLVGTFKKQKGYDIFLSSLLLLDEKIKNEIHFHICGGGKNFNNFKKQLQKYKLNSLVTLHGHIEPNFFYSKCHAYILPSRFEGFSNSLIEALSYGMPVIVSDCPSANREVVIEDFNGIFFNNLDYEHLANKIQFMKENYNKFNKSDIIADTFKRFSIEKISEKYRELIK